jgi:hypothetical protein
VPCLEVLPAANDAELADAVARSMAGDCITLAPGSYLGVALPPGVSLLGRSAHEVHIGALSLGAGSGAWLRGVSVDGGVDVGSATGVRIEAVRIRGGDETLELGAGAVATVVSSEIGGGQLGITGRAPASLTVERSLILESAGPGIAVQCAEASCACTVKPDVSLDRVRLKKNSLVSASFLGVRAAVRQVDIVETQSGANFAPGAGIAFSACSEVNYASLTVKSAGAYGVLIDSSSASPFGSSLEEKGIIVIDGKPGVWVQGIGSMDPNQQVILDGLDIQDCLGSGLGFDLGSMGIIVIDGKVENTHAVEMPVEPSNEGAVASVGIGVVWKALSAVSIQSLTVSGSEGRGFVIDGPVGPNSTIGALTLLAGDETDGVLQQQVADGEAAPTTGGIQLQRSPEKLSDVPVGPDPPVAAQ